MTDKLDYNQIVMKEAAFDNCLLELNNIGARIVIVKREDRTPLLDLASLLRFRAMYCDKELVNELVDLLKESEKNVIVIY